MVSSLHWLRSGAFIFSISMAVLLSACGSEKETLEADSIRAKIDRIDITDAVMLSAGEWKLLEVEANVDGETTNVTRSVAWSSSSNDIASVDSQGILTAHNAGAASIHGEFGSLDLDFRVVVQATACEASTVTVIGDQSPHVGESISFIANAKCADNTTVENATFSWQSSDTTKLTIDSSGRAQAIAEGAVIVSASHEGVTGQQVINIQGDTTLTLSINTSGFEYPAEFCPGKTATLVAKNDRTGQFVTSTTQFTITNTAIATMMGVNVRALSAGQTTISARAGDALGSIAINVADCPIEPEEPEEPEVPEEPVYDGIILRAKSNDGWSPVYIYAWLEETGIENFSGAWPGEAMNSIGNGWFEYRLPQVEKTNVIFHNGSGVQTIDMPNITESQWCVLTGAVCAWSENNPDKPTVPEVPMAPDTEATVSPAGGSFSDSLNVTTSWTGTAVSSCLYSTDGTNPSIVGGSDCDNGDRLTLGQDLQEGQSLTLTVCSLSEQWRCADYFYTKSGEPAFDWDNATVYFVITDRFNDGNSFNNNSYGRSSGNGVGQFQGGDIAGLTQKLNEGYFSDLGVTAIWLTAPYEQVHGWVWGTGNPGSFEHYGYHGYYPLDYTVMDKNMGTEAEFREFVNTAHNSGIRVVMDVVMNHAGYATVDDLREQNIDVLNGDEIDWQSNNWIDWWGSDWVRADIGGGYSDAGCGIDDCPLLATVDFLPDFKTETNNTVGLPPFLQRKSDTKATALNTTVRGHIITWLSDWVREYGIDGFRADTVKHVDSGAWRELQQSAAAAYEEWKQNNGGSPFAEDQSFWLTGEYWNHNASNNAPNGQRYQDVGFDSMINFDFKGAAAGATYNFANIDGTYQNLQNVRNGGLSMLNYLSSHDTSLFYDYNNDRQKAAGSLLLMAPGPAQIFYGDETSRPPGPDGGVPMHATRSFMNWDSINSDVLAHWQKLGQFRRAHVAIGAGEHRKLSDAPYTFSRTTANDKVVVVLGAGNQDVSVNVAGVFANGQTVVNAYNNQSATVNNGFVTFNGGANGTILISE